MKVVRVTAIWCMSCLVMKRRYDQIFKTLDIDQVIDLDYDQDDISSYHIGDVLPVVIFFEDDEERLRIIGEKSKKTIHKLLEKINK